MNNDKAIEGLPFGFQSPSEFSGHQSQLADKIITELLFFCREKLTNNTSPQIIIASLEAVLLNLRRSPDYIRHFPAYQRLYNLVQKEQSLSTSIPYQQRIALSEEILESYAKLASYHTRTRSKSSVLDSAGIRDGIYRHAYELMRSFAALGRADKIEQLHDKIENFGPVFKVKIDQIWQMVERYGPDTAVSEEIFQKIKNEPGIARGTIWKKIGRPAPKLIYLIDNMIRLGIVREEKCSEGTRLYIEADSSHLYKRSEWSPN